MLYLVDEPPRYVVAWDSLVIPRGTGWVQGGSKAHLAYPGIGKALCGAEILVETAQVDWQDVPQLTRCSRCSKRAARTPNHPR
jgi:hypothetical protein